MRQVHLGKNFPRGIPELATAWGERRKAALAQLRTPLLTARVLDGIMIFLCTRRVRLVPAMVRLEPETRCVAFGNPAVCPAADR
jgi:hypothetical protein